MKTLKNKVSITLDEDVIIKIKELSENDDRSFSQYINMVLKEHIVKMEKNKKQYCYIFFSFILYIYFYSIHIVMYIISNLS